MPKNQLALWLKNNSKTLRPNLNFIAELLLPVLDEFE